MASIRTGHGGRARILAALVSAGALALASGPAASASVSPSTFRTQRLCETRRPGAASCVAIRLLPRSLSGTTLRADAVRQAHESAHGATPAVVNKSPVGGGLSAEALHAAYALPDETFGATQTIAIVDAYNDPTAEADLEVYSKQFGLPVCTAGSGCFKKVDEQGKTSPLPANQGEWSTEISLDLDMSHAICQSCHLLLVEGSNEEFASLGTAVDTAVKDGATEVSNSYAGVEESYVTSANAAYDHPGVVITASSGDCGYLDQACWKPGAPNFPADSPDIVSVGGTALTQSGESWTSTVWEDGGSACSRVFTAPLWQSSVANFSATGCAGARASADVAADADPWTGVDVYDSTPAGNGDPTGWIILGGTSASSPIVAAEFGLAGGAHGVSFPAETLYSNAGDASVLTDVVSGHNGSCESATICQAAAGYDGPTGVGSPHGLGAFSAAGSPLPGSPPAISGTAEQGQTLTVGRGEWSGSPTSYSQQWVSCAATGSACTAISGATGTSYTLPSGAVGDAVRVQVSARNGVGAGPPSVSAPTAAVISDAPKITSFSPTSGITGATAVKITGTAFTGATSVRFDNVAATFKVLSGTEIEATVPSGAGAGAITVTTPVSSVTSASRFTPTFSLTSFSPARAAPNTTVTLTGIGFTSSSEVFFDGTRAADTYVSPTEIRAVVPAEAKTGAITIENGVAPAGVISGAGKFTVLE